MVLNVGDESSIEDQSCPGDWNPHTLSAMSVRGCAGADRLCKSAYSDQIGSEYSKVCRRVIGVGAGDPDGFYKH